MCELLLDALLDLLRRGRHLGGGAPVGDRDLRVLAGRRLDAEGAARRVEGHIAAADHDHPLADGRRAPKVDLTQEVDGLQGAFEVVAGHGGGHPLLQSDAEEHGLVVAGEQRVDREIDAAALVEAQVDAERADLIDLALQHLVRQAVVGDADAQHAAGDGERLEHRGLVAVLREVAGRRHAGGAPADDGDLLRVQHRQLLRQFGGAGDVADEALEAGDGDRLVDLAARALGLAGVGADAATHRREGVGLRGHPIGVGEAALADQGDVALGRGLHGAGALAGRVAQLVDGVGAGDGLRIELVDGLALAQPLVVPVLDGDGTHRDAVVAARAEIGVHVAGVVVDLRLEVTGLALEIGELGVRDDLDVEVAAGLHELGRQRAHGAVVGGERLVELGHVPAKCGRPLDEVDLVAAFGQIKRTLDAGDASTQHEGGSSGLGGCARHTTPSTECAAAGP